MEKNTIVKIVIAILVLVAIVGGIVFYTNSQKEEKKGNKKNTNTNTSVENVENEEDVELPDDIEVPEVTVEDIMVTAESEEAKKLAENMKEIYGKLDLNQMPAVEIREIMEDKNIPDLDLKTLYKNFTGLDDTEDIECVVASEPMMGSFAYSMVMVKVKDGADAEKIAKDINEKVDHRKWICVSAEEVKTAVSGDVVFLIMSEKELTNDVYNAYKKVNKNIDKEFTREVEEPNFEDDGFVPEV